MSSFDEYDAFEGASLSARAMAARPAPYLEGLNPEQRAAVEAMDGPVLMLAGAGTGKTKALTTRIVHLLNTGRAAPNEILAVTFTNKAAREMKLRVGQMLGQPAEGMPWLGTFHSVCVKLLRRHAELAGLKSNFTILDTDDQIRLLKQLIALTPIDDKRWPARMLAGVIDGWKNRALTPSKVPASESGAYGGYGVELYQQYQKRLLELNAVDFGDLLLHVVTIFQTHDDVLRQYQRWFKYILVDEYQDTNVAQYLWLRLLAGAHKNICCVGDDDQSIYGWRGAEVGNILRFEKDFPGSHVVRLEQNYRSTPHILAAASGVIAGNADRLGKELWTAETEGEKVRLIGHWDGEEEARWIGEELESMSCGRGKYSERRQNPRSISPDQENDRLAKNSAVRTHGTGVAVGQAGDPDTDFKSRKLGDPDLMGVARGYSLDECAILVRASHQMRAFEDRFLTIGLPYRVIGGPRFYERMEIRDAMAYFRVVTQPSDDLAFERIVNTPKRGLGDKAQQKMQIAARENGVPLIEGARILLAQKGIGGKGASELAKLIEGIDRWRAMMRGPDLVRDLDDDAVLDAGEALGEPLIEPLIEPLAAPMQPAAAASHMDLAEQILDESGYTAMWQNDKSPEAPGRLENLKELVKALENFDNLQGFLEHVALIMDNESDDREAKVSIMTLHAAKGLEFPAVFLPGWEDGLFPSQRSMDESGNKGVEEERRLAYVGITRAEEICTISFAGNRRVFGQWQNAMPSRFIDELPEEHVDVLTPPGLHGGGYGAARGSFSGTEAFEERVSSSDVYNSPGWRRMQARAAQRPSGAAASVTIEAKAVSTRSVGERVFHQKFGYGAILAIEGDKLEIAFEKAGTKKVVAKFVTSPDDIPF